MPATLGPKTFQNQPVSNETRRRLDALQQQVDQLSQPAQPGKPQPTVRAWRKQAPGQVGGGLRKP